MRRWALLLLPLLSALALADERPAPASTPAVSPEILKAFQAIEALAARAAYADAERKARQVLPQLQYNPAAQALLLRNLATLHGLQQHYPQAAETLAQSLALKALPEAEATQALWEMGQYHLAAENYPEAARALEGWLGRTPKPKPEQLLLLADIRSRLGHYAEAASLVEQAIALAPAPKREWHQRLLGYYHEARNFQGCTKALESLIRLEPANPLYWQQLTAIYQEAGQEQQALAVRQLMYGKGMLRSPEEIVQLAQVLRYRRLPSRAAELLQSAMGDKTIPENAKNLELMAEAWTEARELEKAAMGLEKAAALSAAGDTYHRLGQIYSELHDWAKARQALVKALDRGRLRNAGGAYLLLGLAQYRLNARDQARQAFIKARETPAVRKPAQQWLEHMDREAQQSAGASG